MKRIMSAILLAASCFTGFGQEVESFVTGLLEQYTEARLLDIYKSCFQDYMGAEHLVSDTASVRAYLEQELATIDLIDMQSWYFEPCGTDGNYVRVSLRAVKEGLISADSLLEAFIASANNTERPTVESWTARWHEIISLIDGMDLSLPHYDQDKRFIEDVLAQGKYAISHSPEYRDAYAPHYRIVRRDIFERDLARLLPHPCPCCH
jgi:hypothetical protein